MCTCKNSSSSNNNSKTTHPACSNISILFFNATRSLAIKIHSSFNEPFKLLPRTHSREHQTPQTCSEASHKIFHLEAKLRHNVDLGIQLRRFFIHLFILNVTACMLFVCDIMYFAIMASSCF